MRKIILIISIAVAFLFGFKYRGVLAFSCTGWSCDTITDPFGNTSQTCSGTPAGCVDYGNCPDCGEDVSCPPGKYVCNRGCCDIGSGGGGGGGGGHECGWSQANCGSNQVLDTSNVVSSICGGISYCPGPGTAQAFTGCCRYGGGGTTCGDWYSCPKPANPGRMCRDCVTEEQFCVANTIVTYGCRSLCNSTAPTSLSIVQGSSATTANVSWTVGAGGTYQLIRVDEDQSEVLAGCPTPNDCEVKAQVSAATNSYIVTGLQPSRTYWFRVVTYESATCSPSQITSYTTPANNSVSGRVYMDANNVCSTSTPWNSATYGSLTASLRGTAYSGTVGTDGRFSILAGTAPSFQYMDLSGIPTGYICSTAAGCNSCPTLSSITSPSSTNYFYLTPRREAWWQAVGASVYAEGDVRSELPTASLKLIETGAGGAVGALMRSTGTVDTGVGTVSTPGYSATTEYQGKLMNYDYFAAHMGVTPNTINDWAVDTMSKPANDPDKVFYYINPSGSEASVSTPWTVSAGESYVIFVNGDLRIASNIAVANGGFLAFIVNGSVRVSPAVTDVAGIYVIDSTLSTESNGGTDVAANFQGSVVAWGGVNLGRDLVAGNLNQAGEKFTYRADLLNNMPDSMKVFALKWEEVVPGTFGQ